MKPGDLVRYKESEFVSDRVYKELVGLVLRVNKNPSSLHTPPSLLSNRVIPSRLREVFVKWNTGYCNTLWHSASTLEIISEIR